MTPIAPTDMHEGWLRRVSDYHSGGIDTTERAQVEVIDPLLGERISKQALRKSGTPRARDRAHVDDLANTGQLSGSDELAHRGAFVADREDAHGHTVIPALSPDLPSFDVVEEETGAGSSLA